MRIPVLSATSRPNHAAILVCAGAMIALAVAMGVGRFAFTPLFPLMVRDGLLDSQAGALLAASNYLGYLIGALAASRLRVKDTSLLAFGLLGTVIVTAAVGLTSSVESWAALRFIAGILSAWALVATSAWALGWLALLGRPQIAGTVFAGVGLGIAAAGLFCLLVARSGLSALAMWVDLGLLAAIAAVVPLVASRLLPLPLPLPLPMPMPTSGPVTPPQAGPAPATPSSCNGLIACYTLFGFGYILPATYLPALARQMVDDPSVFGWAWPLFGAAAAVSTIVVSWGLKKADRVRVWAVCHLIMGAGVLIPSIWNTFASIAISAFFVGGTFMVITMVGMQETRSRVPANATGVLGRMTAGFAFGQLMGPVASALIGRFTTDHDAALHYGLALSAAGLLLSAVYLWREAARTNR
jgi:MFS family permease